MEQTVKKKFGIRDIMTIAAMMVINFAIAMIIGMVTVRNRIGWMVNSIGNFVGCAVPLWWSWDSYQEMAANSGFDANTLNMQLSMVTSPALMLLGVVITAVLAILGTLFGQRLLRKHFQKAGIVG